MLSGPNPGREIMAGQSAAATVACPGEYAARRIQAAWHTSYFRPYTTTDVIGCEVGGAVKNVIALATGVAAGMGPGHIAAAMLITPGLAETNRLATAFGAHPQTLAGPACLGDLVATCTSPLSRNRTFGTNLAQGMSVDEAAPPRGRPPRASSRLRRFSSRPAPTTSRRRSRRSSPRCSVTRSASKRPPPY